MNQVNTVAVKMSLILTDMQMVQRKSNEKMILYALLQEEEMMEIEQAVAASTTPRVTTPNLSSVRTFFPSPSRQPLQQSYAHAAIFPRGVKASVQTGGIVISQNLISNAEYEVSSSGTRHHLATSPHVNARVPLGKGLSDAIPSPDSAIHSVYYSPSQSPNQSRQISGLSSPFSLQTSSSSLSRNNSDASQYGSSSITSLPSSVSITNSPISPPSHQYSPTHSPIQTQHSSGGGNHLPILHALPGAGHGQQYQVNHHPPHPPSTLPSSPLPPSITTSRHLPLPPSAFHGVILTNRNDEPNQHQASLEYAEATNNYHQEMMDEKPPGLSSAAQPGISRQQLINRYGLRKLYFKYFSLQMHQCIHEYKHNYQLDFVCFSVLVQFVATRYLVSIMAFSLVKAARASLNGLFKTRRIMSALEVPNVLYQ